MSMRRARRSSKVTLCCAIWMVPLGAAIVASSARAEPPASTPVRFDLGRADASALLVRVQTQLAELKVGDIDGQPGRPIPLNIEVLDANTANQLYILTGIPEGFTLAPGGYFGKFWAVNPKVMSTLTLTAPDSYSGTFTISIVRRHEGSASTASASFKVTIREAATTETVATVGQVSPADPPKIVHKPNPNEAAYLARGKTLLRSGDISGARAVFEYLAVQGSAAGAMAMGETYDPLLLRALVIKGLEADAEKARKWYLRAEELGGPDARSRLNELAGR